MAENKVAQMLDNGEIPLYIQSTLKYECGRMKKTENNKIVHLIVNINITRIS